MRRNVTLACALLSLALVALWAYSTSPGQREELPVYSVATLRLRLREAAQAWRGRTVLVRAVAMGCGFPAGNDSGSCSTPSLVDATAPGATEPLPLVTGDPGSLLAVLRGVPILGHLVASPQQVRWGVAATYRIQVQAGPFDSCDDPPCYRALLLDAAPP